MTQPSLHTSFDTSLVDVQRSFSSTNTNTSGSSGKENQIPATEPAVPSRTENTTTAQLYDQWANTYDTDGNVLQAVDDHEMQRAIPDFCSMINSEASKNPHGTALRLLDLGCGTGRNTVKLLQCRWVMPTMITGWDASAAMLGVAKEKCTKTSARGDQGQQVQVELTRVDFGDQNDESENSVMKGRFEGVISTLVLEHLPLETFFAVLSRVLEPGGIAFVSNMHPDMGASTRAGFKDQHGKRLAGASYAHGIDDTLSAARKVGLELVGSLRETAVTEQMLNGGELDGVMLKPGCVGDRGKKWLGIKVWYGLMLKKSG